MPQNQSYKSQQDKIKEATEKLEAGIQDFLSSEKYQDYLKVMSRFHNYSYSNSILIALQKPDASLLAGYAAWDKKFGRHPKKGSHAIRIFAPAPVKTNTFIEREKLDPDTKLPVLDEDGNPVMESVAIKRPAFKVVSVFDISDTEGKPIPELEVVHPLSGDVTQYDSFLEAIRRTSTVPIGFEQIESGANGYFDLKDKRIAVQEGMSELQTIKTAIHELAHSRLHDIDTSLSPNKQPVQKDRATKEVEAESIAFVVSEHFGLDTSDYSFGYVGTWSSDKELPELKSSLQTIRDASNSIITEMESHLLEIQQERQAEQVVEQEAAAWHYYIIPDFMTWAQPHGEKPETPKERFDSLEDAVARFRELRLHSYNLEKTERPDTHIPYARLTLGIQQRESDNNLASLLYVQNGKNVLVDNFTRMPALKDSPEVLDTLSRLGTEIGFQQVLIHRGMTPEEIRDFTYNRLADRLQKSGLPETQQKAYLAEFDTNFVAGKFNDLLPSTGEQIIEELQEFSDWHNPYFTVQDSPERFVADMDAFSHDYDPYDYDSQEIVSSYTQLLTNVKAGNVTDIREWLNEIVEEDSEFSKNAAAFLHRLDELVPAEEKEITSEQINTPDEAAYQIGSRYLHMQMTDDGSWDYSVYDRNLNLTDGGQIGDENTSFFDARNDLLEEYAFPQNEVLTGITPERFAEMLDQHENDLKCPICPLSLSEAREQGKLDDWRICHNANEACAKQFSKEYGSAYHARQVPEFLSQMVERYGMERCKMVLAGTIQLSPWDGRYHPPIREAANQITVPGASDNPDHDARLRYLVNCHPVMIDVAFRDLMAMEQEQSRETEKPAVTKGDSAVLDDKPPVKRERTSVLKKLKSKQEALAAAGNTPKTPERDKPQL